MCLVAICLGRLPPPHLLLLAHHHCKYIELCSVKMYRHRQCATSRGKVSPSPIWKLSRRKLLLSTLTHTGSKSFSLVSVLSSSKTLSLSLILLVCLFDTPTPIKTRTVCVFWFWCTLKYTQHTKQQSNIGSSTVMHSITDFALAFAFDLCYLLLLGKRFEELQAPSYKATLVMPCLGEKSSSSNHHITLHRLLRLCFVVLAVVVVHLSVHAWRSAHLELTRKAVINLSFPSSLHYYYRL